LGLKKEKRKGGLSWYREKRKKKQLASASNPSSKRGEGGAPPICRREKERGKVAIGPTQITLFEKTKERENVRKPRLFIPLQEKGGKGKSFILILRSTEKKKGKRAGEGRKRGGGAKALRIH